VYKRARGWLLFLVAVGFLVNTAQFWYASAERPAHALMEFAQAQTVGETALCVSVWRTTPPATVLFSSTRRMVFTGPTDYELERSWTIPEFYASSTDGSPERWAAGQYERRHAISTSSRSTQPSIVTIPFSVRADCP